jgi:transposase
MMDTEQKIRRRYKALNPVLNEQARRRFAAAEAQALGRGGVALLARITGLARSTIYNGVRDIETNRVAGTDRVRKPGGGRKPKAVTEPTLCSHLFAAVEPDTRGDPMKPLLWTTKSLRQLQALLLEKGHRVCLNVIRSLLRGVGYSLQGNKKTLEGGQHADRDAQFNHINDQVKEFLLSGDPVISIDTKKKEPVGNFKNNGREWKPKKSPTKVNDHDFPNKDLGRAVPYGIYDIGDNSGWVNVGKNHDTAAFAVNAIRCWWRAMGKDRYPNAKRLMITADGGGSNGYRLRLWKVELQKLADELNIPIFVCHLPPGTSKWNKIEHRLFSFITMNWRAQPLCSYRTIVELIGSTTTKTGLKVHAALDENTYPTGVKVTDKQLAAVNLTRHAFHGEWNYTIAPGSTP